jgi:tripeptidyl-peptidase-1
VFSFSYDPIFPASSPYVVSVGATQGPESDKTEVVCAATTGGIITSGGGFSNSFTRPAYQNTVVQSYLNTYTTTSSPAPGYNSLGRGYPDVSLLGFNYVVVIGGSSNWRISGTSASCPVMAAFISLVNANRKLNGGSLVGWVNPALYANYTNYIHDITTGANNCGALNADGTTVTCCAQGFSAVPGW